MLTTFITRITHWAAPVSAGSAGSAIDGACPRWHPAEKSMKNFVAPAVLAIVAALLTVALAGCGTLPGVSAEQTAAGSFPFSLGAS